jgi:hypothetical protein
MHTTAEAMAGKIFLSALLLNTITDAIRGFSIDLLSPLVDAIVPGSIKTPVSVFGIQIYPTRFVIRLVNVALAFSLAKYAIQRKNNYL